MYLAAYAEICNVGLIPAVHTPRVIQTSKIFNMATSNMTPTHVIFSIVFITNGCLQHVVTAHLIMAPASFRHIQTALRSQFGGSSDQTRFGSDKILQF